jgi:hypothetical protein
LKDSLSQTKDETDGFEFSKVDTLNTCSKEKENTPSVLSYKKLYISSKPIVD